MRELIAASAILDIGLVLCQLLLLLLPVLPYIPQYLEIRKTRDASGFSLYVCLGLITSACIRIAYWVGHNYDIALFLQNFVMIGVLLLMINEFIKIENRRTYTAPHARNFTDFNVTQFWNWTNLISYVQATVFFMIIMIFLSSFFSWIPGVLMCVGIAALVVDTMLTLPQFIKNWLNRTTFGVNKSMVALWVIGDVLKLLYFTLRDIPYSFVLCSVLQLLIDLGVLWQIFHYGDAPNVPTVFDLREYLR